MIIYFHYNKYQVDTERLRVKGNYRSLEVEMRSHFESKMGEFIHLVITVSFCSDINA